MARRMRCRSTGIAAPPRSPVGARVLPPATSGQPPRTPAADDAERRGHYRRDRVSIMEAVGRPGDQIGRFPFCDPAGYIYEVVPEGPLEADPDPTSDGKGWWLCAAAQVTRCVWPEHRTCPPTDKSGDQGAAGHDGEAGDQGAERGLTAETSTNHRSPNRQPVTQDDNTERRDAARVAQLAAQAFPDGLDLTPSRRRGPAGTNQTKPPDAERTSTRQPATIQAPGDKRASRLHHVRRHWNGAPRLSDPDHRRPRHRSTPWRPHQPRDGLAEHPRPSRSHHIPEDSPTPCGSRSRGLRSRRRSDNPQRPDSRRRGPMAQLPRGRGLCTKPTVVLASSNQCARGPPLRRPGVPRRISWRGAIRRPRRARPLQDHPRRLRHRGPGDGLLRSSASRICARARRAAGCTDLGRTFNTFAPAWTQQRCSPVSGNTSRIAAQNPNAPSPTANFGARMPRRLQSRSRLAQLIVDSR